MIISQWIIAGLVIFGLVSNFIVFIMRKVEDGNRSSESGRLAAEEDIEEELEDIHRRVKDRPNVSMAINAAINDDSSNVL